MALGADTLRSRPVRGRLSELETDSTGGNLYFPGDLATQEHWVAFRISKDTKFRRDEVSKKDSQAVIILPMPSSLGTQYNAAYNAEGLGPLAGFGAGMSDSVQGALSGDIGPGEFIQSLKANFESGGKEGFTGGLMNIASQGLEEGLGTLAGAFIGENFGPLGTIAGAGAGAAVTGGFKAGMGAAGIARNPHLATLFTGVNFRTHQFSYKFVPKSRDESETLRDIISKFKYHMAPGFTAAGHFFTYPENFDIEFHYPEYLFDIGASVLTSFDVQYHGEGASFYFDETNAPVSVSISMSFQELTINTKENINLAGASR